MVRAIFPIATLGIQSVSVAVIPNLLASLLVVLYHKQQSGVPPKLDDGWEVKDKQSHIGATSSHSEWHLMPRCAELRHA